MLTVLIREAFVFCPYLENVSFKRGSSPMHIYTQDVLLDIHMDIVCVIICDLLLSKTINKMCV